MSTTNAIGLGDFGAVQALIPDTASIVVELDPQGTSTQSCDLRISGSEPHAEVIEQIVDLMVKRQILGSDGAKVVA